MQNVCARNDVVIKVQSQRFLYVHNHFVIVFEIKMLAENCFSVTTGSRKPLNIWENVIDQNVLALLVPRYCICQSEIK